LRHQGYNTSPERHPPLLIIVLADIDQVLEVVAVIFQAAESMPDFRK